MDAAHFVNFKSKSSRIKTQQILNPDFEASNKKLVHWKICFGDFYARQMFPIRLSRIFTFVNATTQHKLYRKILLSANKRSTTLLLCITWTAKQLWDLGRMTEYWGGGGHNTFFLTNSL